MAERRRVALLSLVVALTVGMAIVRGVAWRCACVLAENPRLWRCGCLTAKDCCHGG